MPSPFPGMNPYLEHPFVWQDFHDRFLVYAAEALNLQTVPTYLVRIGEHVFVSDPETDSRPEFHADLSASPPRAQMAPAHGTASSAVLTPPTKVTLPEDYERNRLIYLEVVDREDRRVVTVIELLSHANKKPGRDRRQFETKRSWFPAGDANYVEIDLLRGWPRLPWMDDPVCEYYAAVSRPDDRPEAAFWPIRLRGPLPKLEIPLRPGDPMPVLDLQAILHKVYDAAGYQLDIYTRPVTPPLPPADAAWAEEIVRAATAPV